MIKKQNPIKPNIIIFETISLFKCRREIVKNISEDVELNSESIDILR